MSKKEENKKIDLRMKRKNPHKHDDAERLFPDSIQMSAPRRLFPSRINLAAMIFCFVSNQKQSLSSAFSLHPLLSSQKEGFHHYINLKINDPREQSTSDFERRFKSNRNGVYSIRNTAILDSIYQSEDNELDDLSCLYNSHIETIRCQNIAGMVNTDTDEIVIHLGHNPNLVAVTGETGSGKSLLVSKVLNFVMGNKASQFLIPTGSIDEVSFATGEVSLKLSEPHITLTRNRLSEFGLDSEILEKSDDLVELVFKRTMERSSVKKSGGKGRLRNKCKINGKEVTLKVLRAIASPLIITVDAVSAASALSQLKARIGIVDANITSNVSEKVRSTSDVYREARKVRENLEKELEDRIMPASFSSNNLDEVKDLELLQHWIDEFDEFENRIDAFQHSITSSPGVALLLKRNDVAESTDQSETHNSFIRTLRNFSSCSWSDCGQAYGNTAPSSFYSSIVDLRDTVNTLDNQLLNARLSCEVLCSLASSQSAASAIEQSRKLLFDATNIMKDDTRDSALDPVLKAAERSHDLLNTIEEALDAAYRFMEDNPDGLIMTLKKQRQSIYVSVEEFDALIADWGSLSRKHGILPFSLPSCHQSLRQEQSKNVEARLMLPRAKTKEKIALDHFEQACKIMTDARSKVCAELSRKVTARLPSLGMNGSIFKAQRSDSTHSYTDLSVHGKGSILGLDKVDFLLLHGKEVQREEDVVDESNLSDKRGGALDVVGSAGEKARILLAIETDFPGSIGTSISCNEGEIDKNDGFFPPVAVVYDEIDAHVGGRAAVAIADLLSEQTSETVLRKGQVISITHSPSLAAIADRHICVQKVIIDGVSGQVEVSVNCVEGALRRKELARMASGDLAPAEADLFAAALLRDGLRRKDLLDKK